MSSIACQVFRCSGVLFFFCFILLLYGVTGADSLLSISGRVGMV
jgi:hypothetical protein